MSEFPDRLRRLVCIAFGAAILPAVARAAAAPATPGSAAPQEKLDLENTLYLDLEYGRVVIKMHPELAPKHVARVKQLHPLFRGDFAVVLKDGRQLTLDKGYRERLKV